jgi:hypothetical protein
MQGGIHYDYELSSPIESCVIGNKQKYMTY